MAERPLWTPSSERIEEANLTRFARQAIRDWKLGLNDYPAFYRWTIEHPEQFWDSLWKFASVRASAKGTRVLVNGDRIPGARWYPEARLNFAENLLRRIAARLPSLKRVVVVPYLSDHPDVSAVPGAQRLEDFIVDRPATDIPFEQLPFDHPLYILFSSGTTGVPKCIVHGAGGALLKHLCEQQLHCDIKPGDRLFYFTTLGWMMWNWLASALASGATLLLYDGSPFVEKGNILFDYADAEGATHLGTSAKFLDAAAKAGVEPVKTHRLEHLRTVLSTGSPLAPE